VPPNTDRDRAGEEIAGRYVIEAEIGRGGMGAVYAARDTRLGRRVALKAVASDSKAQTRQRLEAEARAVASIEHPGIVTLFDVVEHASETLLVMELVVGVTVREMLKERVLSPEEVANIVYEVSDALAAAHAKNLVHRDVKPDNVMVRADGRIALLDFGIAKVTSEGVDPLAATTTGAGVIVGTPAYLSPEQARGEPIGPKTDQFALAVTAYELLTQSLPWPTNTPMMIVAAIVSSDPKPLTGYDEAVGGVITRALAKNPADRFPHIRDFASALGAALGVAQPSRPRSLLPTSHGVPAPSSSARRLAPSTLEIGKTLRATESHAPSPARPSRRSTLVVAAVALAAAATAVWLGTHRPKAPLPATPSDPATTLALADVPASETTSAEARAKFREAMRQLSVGRGNAPVNALLDAAIAADPEFASAYLQRAFISYRFAGGMDAPGRSAFRAALQRKDRLGARDAEFLDALTPSFADPPDWKESGARLEAMLARRPSDAEIWEALGILRFKQSHLEAADAAFEREQAVDPNAHASYFFRGHARGDFGDLAGARKLFAECIARIPMTFECRAAIAKIDRVVGECAASDRVAREAALLAPEQPLVYEMRAESAAALGAPDDGVIELLTQKRARMPQAERAAEKASDDLRLAMRHGNFPAALDALEAIERSVNDPKMDELGKWVTERASVLREMGDAAKSGAVAMAFLDRMTAHVIPEQPGQDPTGRLLAMANASGRLSDIEYVRRRDEWVSGWRARLGEGGWQDDGIAVWLSAYASATDPSPERAKEAFAVLPQFGTYDAKRPDASIRLLDPEVGALFLAAGKLEEANLRLGDATRWCQIAPFVRAFYSDGETRARMGDKAGACEAFAAVERQWGHAKPRSVTLEAARAAMKKYGCVN